MNEQETAAWLAVIRTHAWINQRLAQDMLQEDSVRIAWYAVLIALYEYSERERGLRMQDLIDRCIISNSGMTRLVDRLVEEGLTERHVYEENRREVYVQLTEQGRALIERLKERHQERIQRYYLQYFSPEELAMVQQIYTRIQAGNAIPAVD